MPTITNNTSSRQAGIATAASSVVSKPPAPAAACCCPACAGLECLSRTRFFAGQLLSEADLNNEQAYLVAKNRLHNRYLVGTGVVCGLRVVCSSCDGWVTVKAGYAIDACGNDIIVCADQPFNVVAAINACCKPARQSSCMPPRPAPPAACQDALQKWCITIQYKEQPTRSVAPLKASRSNSASSCSCGCGGSSKGGCGCGGSHSSSKPSSSSCCCSSTSPATPAATSTACEPSRILETFQLGVCLAPDDTASLYTAKPVAGMAAQIKACIQPLEKLVLQAPNFVSQGVTDLAAAYSAACNYLAQVKKYIATASITHCGITIGIDQMQMVAGNSIAAIQAQVNSIVQQLSSIVMECICLAVMPSCPPSPCDDCLVLACVTVRGGEVIDICHFDGGRKQVISFPSVLYWLSALGINLQETLTSKLEELCCATQLKADGSANYAPAFNAAKRPVQDMSTANLANPAFLSQIFSSGIAQQLGASLVNAATATNDTVDLRPLVGQNLQSVTATLERLKVKTSQADASQLSDYELASSAPAAFPISQPLTILTSNQLVVGFQPTSPTNQLQLQIAQLQTQVEALQKQIGGNTITRSKKG
jgi:hypothetical protein